MRTMLAAGPGAEAAATAQVATKKQKKRTAEIMGLKG
jgi:hypothetical protein